MRMTVTPFYKNQPTMSSSVVTREDLARLQQWYKEWNVELVYVKENKGFATAFLPIECACCIESLVFANITNEDVLKLVFDANHSV